MAIPETFLPVRENSLLSEALIQEGYSIYIRFSHHGIPTGGFNLYTINVLSPQNAIVGTVDLHVYQRDGIRTGIEKGLFVNAAHRRKGVATSMYIHAEKALGITIVKDSKQSDACKAFWAQKDRPFGGE
jgi:hypothetical protein